MREMPSKSRTKYYTFQILDWPSFPYQKPYLPHFSPQNMHFHCLPLAVHCFHRIRADLPTKPMIFTELSRFGRFIIITNSNYHHGNCTVYLTQLVPDFSYTLVDSGTLHICISLMQWWLRQTFLDQMPIDQFLAQDSIQLAVVVPIQPRTQKILWRDLESSGDRHGGCAVAFNIVLVVSVAVC